MDRSNQNTLILLLICPIPAMLTVVADTLSSQGYLVRKATDIGTAVDRLKECAADLLIIRPYINSMPGHEAAKYLRTWCPGLRILMVGGLMDDNRLSYRDALRHIHVFPKPFTESELLQAVEQSLTSEPQSQYQRQS